MIKISDEAFRKLVAEAVERIPDAIQERIKNVAILVEDELDADKAAELGLEEDEDLLGLFEGVTRGEERGGSHLPPVIRLFRLPILEDCETLEDVEQEISDTLWHEVAHYLGLDEEDVHREEQRSDALRKLK